MTFHQPSKPTALPHQTFSLVTCRSLGSLVRFFFPPTPNDRKVMLFNNPLPKRADNTSAKRLLNKTKLFQAIIHCHGEKLRVVLMDAFQPMPFFVGQVFAFNHRCLPFLASRIDHLASIADQWLRQPSSPGVADNSKRFLGTGAWDDAQHSRKLEFSQ